jgi:hypothetical protein
VTGFCNERKSVKQHIPSRTRRTVQMVFLTVPFIRPRIFLYPQAFGQACMPVNLSVCCLSYRQIHCPD